MYQNRAQFIKISQEAERLRGEMRSLRNLMSDLTSTLGQTNAALGIEPTDTRNASARKFANRSSVANLEAMWSTHLQELWRRVEGSQKFLPAIPGRHVVHESGRWVELNTATFKPRRRVHLILLNDHLLAAVEKQRSDTHDVSEPSSTLSPGRAEKKLQSPAATTLVADRCLHLQDVEIADLSMKSPGPAAGSIRRVSRQPNSNAVNIRVGQDSFTYATSDQDGSEKTSFLAKFRKAVSDLRKTQTADTDERSALGVPGSSANRKNSRSPAGRGNPASPTLGSATNGADAIARGSMLVEVDGRQQSFRWVEQQVDELDIDVALQRYASAVDRIEHLRSIALRNKSNVYVQDLVNDNVGARAAKLAKGILRDVAEEAALADATKKNVSLLQRLGFESAACDRFLDARDEVVKMRISQCADTGDLGGYLFQLAWITFTLVRNTILVFQGAFSAGFASSGIKWAKLHADAFNRVLVRQVARMAEAEKEGIIAKVKGCEERLRDVGIDFSGLVGRGADGREVETVEYEAGDYPIEGDAARRLADGII